MKSLNTIMKRSIVIQGHYTKLGSKLNFIATAKLLILAVRRNAMSCTMTAV